MSKAFIAPGLVNPEQFGENKESAIAAVEEMGILCFRKPDEKHTVTTRVSVVKPAEDPIDQAVTDAIIYAQNLGID